MVRRIAMSFSNTEFQGLFRRQGPILYLLLAHVPMVSIFAFESLATPLYRTVPLGLACLLWISLRHCANRPQDWRPLPVLMVILDVCCVLLGIWRGSAWLVTFGGSLLAAGWILACSRNIPGRMIFAVMMLLGLIVRFPPLIDERLQNRFQRGVSEISSDILNASGVIHFTDAAGLHVTGKVLDSEMLRGGIASAWLLIVIAVVFSATERRSGPHLICLMLYSVLLGIILSAASTTLGAVVAVAFDTDVSRSIAGVIWRLAILIVGLVSIWSADKAVLLFTGGIPVMEELVTGRKVPRHDDDDDPDEEQRIAVPNALSEVFNKWVAPTPRLVEVADVAESTVMASAATLHRGEASHDCSSAPEAALPEAVFRASGVHGERESMSVNSPAAVKGLLVITSVLIFAAQLVRLLCIGG